MRPTTARILYEEFEANTVGSVTAKVSTVAGFTAAKTAILADTNLATAMDGNAVNDVEGERHPVSLLCSLPPLYFEQLEYRQSQLKPF